MKDGSTGPFSRRIRATGIAGRLESSNEPLRPVRRAWLLHLLPLLLAMPVLVGLLTGDFARSTGSIAAIALLVVAARTMRRGLRNESEFAARQLARQPKPLKTAAHLLTGSAVFSLAMIGAGDSVAMAALYASLAAIASFLVYGGDPRRAKTLDPQLAERSGMNSESVIAAIEEARGKLAAIERDARHLHNRELSDRLARIVDSGRRILTQIERDPRDIRRARRFLVTFLDGTRDVVGRFRERQHDLAGTPLGENFRHILETVEHTFAEQEQVLRQNDTLDLEVQIEVLRTQMQREGVN